MNAPNAGTGGAAPSTARPITRPYAWYALGVLSFINLINYLDRNVLPPVMESVKETFRIDDTQAGSLVSAFFVVYTLASPLAGYLGDRVSRRLLISLGILLWSVSTVASAFSGTFEHLWFWRACTGVGEACYGIVAPAFLSDLFSKESRARTLSVFYLALPVGTAAGYAFGGYVGRHFGHEPDAAHDAWLCTIGLHEGWRYAFLFGGIPGILLALLTQFLREPVRGGMDVAPGEHVVAGKFQLSAVWTLLKTRSFVANVAATTAMTFAIGGLAAWVPAYVERVLDYPKDEAGLLVGLVVAGAGTVGTVSGGFAADFVRRWTRSAHFVVPGITLACSAICLGIAFLYPSRTLFWTWGGIGIFFLFCNSGPLNAAILNVSMPNVRATAFAITIFTIHLLGDAFSPIVIGAVSDYLQESQKLSAGEALRYAFFLAPPIVLLGATILLLAAKHLPRDVDAVEAAMRRRSEDAAGS